MRTPIWVNGDNVVKGVSVSVKRTQPPLQPIKPKSRGLGDTVEKVLSATGIKSVVEGIFGEDCGCSQRKEKLNELFPYGNTEITSR